MSGVPIADQITVELGKSCAVCGQQLVGRPGDKAKRFCGDICRNAFWSSKHTTGKQCERCGSPLVATRFNASRQRFCSKSCASKSRPPPHKRMRARLCAMCNEPFQPTAPQQRWCTVCMPSAYAYWLWRVYGMTLAEYNAMLSRQDGKCKICGVCPASCVDHDHATNKVRGLLCDKCNTGLYYVEQEVWLHRAQEYLHANQA